MISSADLQAILRCHFASFVEKCFQEVSNPADYGNNFEIFFDELLTFPQCAFKDLCDAFSQAILYLVEHTEAPYISHYAATGLSIRDGYYVGRNTSRPHPMRNPKLGRAYRR